MHRILRAGVGLLAALAVGCGGVRAPQVPKPPPGQRVAILGPARLDAAQLAAWVRGRRPQPTGAWKASEPLEAIARYFVEEGAAEGVAGDVAFVQAVIETGWFRFPGLVPAWKNNFSGLGAVDADPGQAASFPSARIGVRAQVQHLRAYADPRATTCTSPPLAFPCVDPRFDLVRPRGRAPYWNQLGRGEWATDPGYGAAIVQRYREALAFHGLAFAPGRGAGPWRRAGHDARCGWLAMTSRNTRISSGSCLAPVSSASTRIASWCARAG
jgi:hypothetical protein